MRKVGLISKDSAAFFNFRCELSIRQGLMSPHLPPITHPYVFDTSGFLSDILIFCSRVFRDAPDGERETSFLIACFNVKFIN